MARSRDGSRTAISKALIGHVTEEMREHYSTVGLDENRASVASASVLRLFPGG